MAWAKLNVLPQREKVQINLSERHKKTTHKQRIEQTLQRRIKSKFGFDCSATRTHLDPGYCREVGLRSKWYKLLIAAPNYLLTMREQRNLFVINSQVTIERNIYWVVSLRCILVLTACHSRPRQLNGPDYQGYLHRISELLLAQME